MGLDYSFNVWVTRENLFDTFSTIAKRGKMDELAQFIWPDGRRVPITLPPNSQDEPDLIPFDGSLQRSFCSSLWFRADDELRSYDEEGQERQRRQGTQIYAVPQEDGRYRVGCIYIGAGLQSDCLDWLEEEPLLTRITFTAATTRMSHLFAQSSSIRRFFIELAQEIGAISCDLDREDSGCTLLYLDGEETQVEVQWGLQHPRWLRHIVGLSDTHLQRQLIFCNRLNSQASAHDKMELEFLLRSEDSGLRVAALRALIRVKEEASHSFIKAMSNDPDWRARARTAYLCGYYKIQSDTPILERMLSDPHPEVRIAAALALGQFPTSYETLLSILLSTPAIPPTLGQIKAALTSAARTTFGPRVIETLELCLARPDFPFKQTVQEKLNTFQR